MRKLLISATALAVLVALAPSLTAAAERSEDQIRRDAAAAAYKVLGPAPNGVTQIDRHAIVHSKADMTCDNGNPNPKIVGTGQGGGYHHYRLDCTFYGGIVKK